VSFTKKKGIQNLAMFEEDLEGKVVTLNQVVGALASLDTLADEANFQKGQGWGSEEYVFPGNETEC
jgi:hypothetical protein